MIPNFKLFILLLVTPSQAHLSLAIPVQSQSQLEARTPFRTCAVFVQRWFDNSFDLAAYAYNYTYDGPFEGLSKAEIETTTWPVGQSFTTTQYIGSYPITTTNVADPAVVNGVVNWNDPGKLSFQWGTTTFDTYSSGNPCTTIAVGFSKYGNPTNYTCPFQCDPVFP